MIRSAGDPLPIIFDADYTFYMISNNQTLESMDFPIQVMNDLVLNAGTVAVQSDKYILTPPEITLFDQLWDWLGRHPRKNYGIRNYALGIGATALCFRWGTYLAALMDENKPLDPRAENGNISMISDGEMKRINIEASYNLARLLEKLHADEYEAFDFMLRAYDWLPMPRKSVKPNWRSIQTIYAVLECYQRVAQPFFVERSAQVIQHPYRALANTIVVWAYRSGKVEDVHAGKYAPYSLTHRRFTPRQTREILRGTAEHLSAVMSAKPAWDTTLPEVTDPWPQRLAGLPYATFYPSEWSLDQSSAQVTLIKE
jgi:hypothetical protein